MGGSGRLEKETKLIGQIETLIDGKPKILTAFYHDMVGDNKQYSTIKNYVKYVMDFMDYFNCGNDDEFYNNISASDIKHYIGSLKTKTNGSNVVRLGGSIQAARWSALNTFYNFLNVNDYIDYNPMAKTKRPKHKQTRKIVYLDQHEIHSVFNKIEENATPMLKARDECILSVGIGTGLRVSAIAQINVEDIDFANNVIHVIEKGNKVRDISIGNNTKNAIQKWMNDRERVFGVAGNGPLFLSKMKNRITVYAIEDMVEKYTKHLNKHITPHGMRKTAAMILVREGYSPQAIMKMLGHENIQTTMFYIDAFKNENESMAIALDQSI